MESPVSQRRTVVDGSPLRPLWIYGVNDNCDELPPEVIRAFKATGNFRLDFVALCERCGVVPHAALLPPVEREFSRPDSDGASAVVPETPLPTTLSVQSMLLDYATLRVVRQLLPTSLHLETLRFSSCRLDTDMLGLLRAGLTEACTVTTLQVDWNPLEIPQDAAAVRTALAEGSIEDLDELERRRDKLQDVRTFRAFIEWLEAAHGDLDTALQSVAVAADPKFAGTAMLTPLDLPTWTSAFEQALNLPTNEVEHIFDILDGPYGHGDGMVALSRIQEILEKVPPLTPEEEATDLIGTALAAFVDGTSILEFVSFRYCQIARIEAQAIGHALHSNQHLRALNLWGNRICDRGVEALGDALETNFGLLYLGLGRNLVTHVGLESLCKGLGTTRIDAKEQADHLLKSIKDQHKDREKKAKQPAAPKKDAKGRERYTPAHHVDSCDEQHDLATGQSYWLWSRNCVLKTLVLETNPVADAATVLRLQPSGAGDLVLRGAPCVPEILKTLQQREAEAIAAAAEAAATDEPASSPPPDASSKGQSSPPGTLSPRRSGWNLVLQ